MFTPDSRVDLRAQDQYRVGTCLGVEARLRYPDKWNTQGNTLKDYHMDTITASEAKNQFSALLHKVQTEPVIISRHGRPVAVLMSASEFDAHMSFKLEATRRTEAALL
jgi:prevent-host-death family protein